MMSIAKSEAITHGITLSESMIVGTTKDLIAHLGRIPGMERIIGITEAIKVTVAGATIIVVLVDTTGIIGTTDILLGFSATTGEIEAVLIELAMMGRVSPIA